MLDLRCRPGHGEPDVRVDGPPKFQSKFQTHARRRLGKMRGSHRDE